MKETWESAQFNVRSIITFTFREEPEEIDSLKCRLEVACVNVSSAGLKYASGESAPSIQTIFSPKLISYNPYRGYEVEVEFNPPFLLTSVQCKLYFEYTRDIMEAINVLDEESRFRLKWLLSVSMRLDLTGVMCHRQM